MLSREIAQGATPNNSQDYYVSWLKTGNDGNLYHLFCYVAARNVTEAVFHVAFTYKAEEITDARLATVQN